MSVMHRFKFNHRPHAELFDTCRHIFIEALCAMFGTLHLTITDFRVIYKHMDEMVMFAGLNPIVMNMLMTHHGSYAQYPVEVLTVTKNNNLGSLYFGWAREEACQGYFHKRCVEECQSMICSNYLEDIGEADVAEAKKPYSTRPWPWAC